MKLATIPINEEMRLHALHQYDILDSDMEEAFNEITQLAAQICNTPISLISLIDRNRQWFKAKTGITEAETPRDISFCSHTILQNTFMEVPDTLVDDRFLDHPAVKDDPGIRFYAGFPLCTPDGFNIGSLCVVDNEKRKLTDGQIFALECLSKQVISQMELRLKNKELMKLNEQNLKLLSIITHDIKSPIIELQSLIILLENENLSANQFGEFRGIVKKSLEGTNSLISNLLEWSQSQFKQSTIQKQEVKLASSLNSLLVTHQPLFESKQNSVLNLINSETMIRTNENILHFVLRNIITNSNKFTSSGAIAFHYAFEEGHHIIRIIDNGVGISRTKLNSLFKNEFCISCAGTAGEKGSGIGLKLCKDFIEKIGGEIKMSSELNKGTKVTIILPVE